MKGLVTIQPLETGVHRIQFSAPEYSVFGDPVFAYKTTIIADSVGYEEANAAKDVIVREPGKTTITGFAGTFARWRVIGFKGLSVHLAPKEMEMWRPQSSALAEQPTVTSFDVMKNGELIASNVTQYPVTDLKSIMVILGIVLVGLLILGQIKE